MSEQPKVTWEQFGNPTRPGMVSVEGIGTVEITQYDITFEGRDTFLAVLIPNQPRSDFKIGNWVPKGQIFLHTG